MAAAGVKRPHGGASIEVLRADITTLAVDAIVNAANPALAPGGGVCGAIHHAAGPALASDCLLLGGCPTGDARITPGHRLPSRFVIHAVGPVWQGGGANEAALLRNCYVRALELAQQHGARSVAFPAISTGIYGYPQSPAAAIAVAAVLATLPRVPAIRRVVFACVSDSAIRAHEMALGQALREAT
jgi:O-acetyl-ADP-ribose deacetylase (regulator of RNase III)